MIRLAALLLLGGCVSYADGQRERGALNCELLDACGGLDALGYDDVAACKETAAAQEVSEDDCPNYDADQMSACLAAYRDAIAAPTCDADLTTICQVCG